MIENDIEELLRYNIDMICDEEESMLIVGRQVRNAQHGRSDLTAVDNSGNVVLIEIKRDRKDIEHRKEAFEFQAIRYAASYATITDSEDLVNKIYAPYIEKYREEFENESLTSMELATRKLNEFLQVNGAESNFNKSQNNGEVFLNVEKLLPLADYDDYYVNFLEKTSTVKKPGRKLSRRTLPKIDAMLEWGVVKEGDIIVAKDRDNEATLLSNGNVLADNVELTMQKWLKDIYGWSSVQTYVFAIHKESGKSLSKIRAEYMDKKAEEIK